MKIVAKVKGVDDFGKERLSGNIYQYTHSYPRIAEGDFLIYFYPKDNALGIYQAKDELEYYYDDGFQYCRGKMCRYEKTPLDFFEWIKSKDLELARAFEKTINDLINKHSCARL